MREEMRRERVKGYLRASGRNVVNGSGETVLLNGWGLGNWLLPEGYMWLCGDSGRFERPRRMEAVIRELAGSEYADRFWREFRARYITREDIRLMAQLGYNSVRIPFNWRVLLADEPGLQWIDEGWQLLDNCIDWCEEFGLYAFLDMHGAPGGQTGANIDDSVDDYPRLFTDEDSWHKAIAIWERMAARYESRWIVGGYDLLNEPIRPERPGYVNADHLLGELARFYDECIAAIRKHDTKHLLSVEGHHWATETDVFYKRFDENMVIHFHRYGCGPEVASYQKFLDLAARLNQPLWLGETGENTLEWFAAMYPLAADMGIGYNLWPWKKMRRPNSPLVIQPPEGWDKIIGYTQKGPRPSYEEAQAILSRYLDAVLAENCTHLPEVTDACLRRPGCSVRGTDFDLFPGRGVTYSGTRAQSGLPLYRCETGMHIKAGRKPQHSFQIHFDCGWDSLTLALGASEFAAYSIYGTSAGDSLRLELVPLEAARLQISVGGETLAQLDIAQSEAVVTTEALPLPPAEHAVVEIRVLHGSIELDRLLFCKA